MKQALKTFTVWRNHHNKRFTIEMPWQLLEVADPEHFKHVVVSTFTMEMRTAEYYTESLLHITTCTHCTSRTYNELWLSAPLAPVLGGHPLVLSVPLQWGRWAPLFPNIVVIHHCVFLGFSDYFNGVGVSKVDKRTNTVSWVRVLNVIDWVGLSDAVQRMGMSGVLYTVHHHG